MNASATKQSICWSLLRVVQRGTWFFAIWILRMGRHPNFRTARFSAI